MPRRGLPAGNLFIRKIGSRRPEMSRRLFLDMAAALTGVDKTGRIWPGDRAKKEWRGSWDGFAGGPRKATAWRMRRCGGWTAGCSNTRSAETDENGSPIEVVLGKDGRLMVLEDRVIVMAGGKEAFSAPLETVKSGELMSLDGVVVSGRDDVTGTYATVVGFYI